MANVYGGEIFGQMDLSNAYRAYRDQQALNLQEKRLKAQERREQDKKNYQISNAIRTTFDKNHLTTGTPADPVINAKLTSAIDKYTKIYADSKGSLDLTDMALGMQQDMAQVKAYSDSVKVMRDNAMKSADAVAKQYPGFNKQELYQKALDLGLYKDGKVLENLEDFDLQNDFVNQVIDKGYAGLNIGNNGLYKGINDLPLKTEQKQIVTRDKSGVENMYKGAVTYNDQFQTISYDKDTGEPTINLKTSPLANADGTPYLDKTTGAPVNAIDGATYDMVTGNRQFAARVNQIADEKIAALKAKNIPVTDQDVQNARMIAATEQMDGVFKNRSKFETANKYPIPRGSRLRVGRASDLLPFNLEAMRVDAEGNRDLSNQLGGFTVANKSMRGGSATADLLLTPKGGLIVRRYKYNDRGDRTGSYDDEPLYGQQARNFIEDNGGYPGNKKADLYKLLDLYDEAQPIETPKSPDWPSIQNYKSATTSKSQNKPSTSGSQAPPKPSTKKKGKFD